jgi:flagellar protein FlbD
VIQLTRLRHGDTFYLNPDLIERVDTHVDTVVRLTSGTEYVVVESGDEIVRRTAEFRAQILALASYLQRQAFDRAANREPAHDPADEPAAAVLERWADGAEPIEPGAPETDTNSDTDTDTDTIGQDEVLLVEEGTAS